MSFYYQREAGPEGQIITGEGAAPGVDLSTLVEADALPVRVALELVAYVADIVTVAEEDRAVHGDLGPSDVRVDPTGAVVVDGYGMMRRGGRAPEGKPVGAATDVYGMGALLVTALSGESLGPVPRDRDGHDEAIVQRLLAIDWKHLQGKRWMEDLLRFLSAMFSFAPEERPAPLDVANVLNHVASQAGGDDLITWSGRAVRAAGGTQGKKSTGTVIPQEDLGGPQALGAPMTGTAAFRIRQAASAKGESTAIWSRDRIAAMLAEEDDEEIKQPVRKEWKPEAPSRPKPKPEAPTGPARTSSPPSLPPPAVVNPPSLIPNPRESRPAPPPPDLGAARLPPPPPPPPKAESRGGALPPPPPPPRAQESRSSPPPPAPPIAQQSPFAVSAGPIASAGGASEPADAPEQGSNTMKYVVLGVVLLIVLCAGGSGIGYLVYQKYVASQTQSVNTPAPTPTPTPEPEPEPKVDTGKPTGATALSDQDGKTDGATTADAAGTGATATGATTSAPATTASTTTPSTTSSGTTSSSTPSTTASSGSSSSGRTSTASSSGSSSSGRTSTASGSSSSGRTSSSGSSSSGRTSSSGSSSSGRTSSSSSAAARGPFTVKFVARDAETVVQCGDGQQSSFVGTTRMSFSDVTTCRVKMGPALGVVQISASTTYTCTADSSNKVTCSAS